MATLPSEVKPLGRLEPEYRPHWEAYKAGQGGAAGKLLESLAPALDRSIQSHVGPPDPILRGQARRMTLGALGGYDPQKASLRTYLHHQLKGLVRASARQGQMVRTPERVAIERLRADEAEGSLEAELGRSPTSDELADHLGVPAKRLAYVRSWKPAVNAGAFQDDPSRPAGAEAKRRTLWLDVVLDDLDPYHRSVAEYALGHNRPVLDNQSIAQKLGKSPAAISQAKMRIQRMLDEADKVTEF